MNHFLLMMRVVLGSSLAAAFLQLLLTFPADAAVSPPGRRTPASFQISFDQETVQVSGLRPGTRTAWIGVLRERKGHHTRVHRNRSIVVAGADGTAKLVFPGLRDLHSAWGVVNLDDGEFVTFTSPGYEAWLGDSPPVSARPDRLSVTIGYLELLQVRRNAGAWTFSGADGSDADADRTANGSIEVLPHRMRPMRGNPRPPSHFADGDVLVLVDRARMHVYATRLEQQ